MSDKLTNAIVEYAAGVLPNLSPEKRALLAARREGMREALEWAQDKVVNLDFPEVMDAIWKALARVRGGGEL